MTSKWDFVKAKSSIGFLIYEMKESFVISRALLIIFSDISTPTTDLAPCSRAYRQCQPKPQPKSRTYLFLRSGMSSINICHSPAPLCTLTERSICTYAKQKIELSYLFCFIVNAYHLNYSYFFITI